jgi:hypothetical protein
LPSALDVEAHDIVNKFLGEARLTTSLTAERRCSEAHNIMPLTARSS